jgi:hypothetical protein
LPIERVFSNELQRREEFVLASEQVRARDGRLWWEFEQVPDKTARR